MNKPLIGITGDIKGGRYSIKIAYANAVENAGACPVFLYPIRESTKIRMITRKIDALLISGGKDIDPAFYGEKIETPIQLASHERFFFEKSLLREIIRLRKSVLGICYGMQFLNVFNGGTLYQDLNMHMTEIINHKHTHSIKIYNKSKLYDILGVKSIKVNSTHHQGVKRIGKGLTVSAYSKDNLVEAIELKDYPYFIGVQWHPERIFDKYSQRLFKSFVNAVNLIG